MTPGKMAPKHRRFPLFFHLLLLPVLIASCTGSPQQPTPAPVTGFTNTPIQATSPVSTETPAPTPTPILSLPVGIGTPIPETSLKIGDTTRGYPVELARWGKGTIYQMQITPDNRYIVLGMTSGVYLYDLATMQEAAYFNDKNLAGKYLDISPDGRYLAAAPSDRGGNVYDLSTKKYLFSLNDFNTPPNDYDYGKPHFAFTPDGKYLACILIDSYTIQYFSLPDGNPAGNINPPSGDPTVSLVFSGDGSTVSIISRDQLMQYDTTSKENTFNSTYDDLNGYTVSKDHSIIALNELNKIEFIDIKTGKSKFTIPAQIELNPPVNKRPLYRQVEISPDNNYAAVITNDWQVCPLVLKTRSSLPCLPYENYYVYFSIQFSPDSRWLVTTSFSGISWWDTSTWKMVYNIPRASSVAENAYFSPDGSTFLSFQHTDTIGEPSINKYSILNQTENSSFFVDPNPVGSILIKDTYNHPNNLILADTRSPFFSESARNVSSSLLISGINSYRSWIRPDNGKRVALSILPFTGSHAIEASSPDTRKVGLAFGENPQLNVLAVDVEKQSASEAAGSSINFKNMYLPGEQDFPCSSLSISNSGLVACSIKANKSSMTNIWSIDTGKNVGGIADESDMIALSPDGTRIASLDISQYLLRVDDITNPSDISEIKKIEIKPWYINVYSPEITVMVFSPDGNSLVLGHDNGDIQYVDISTGEKGLLLQGHVDEITGLVFSPDGKLLYSSSYDGTIRVWGMKPKN